jgi:LPS export ABC transporter protein LptC
VTAGRLSLVAVAAAVGVACSDPGVRPETSVAVADSADQKIIGMSTRDFADGIQRAYVQAETAYVYQARQVMDLRQMRTTFFDDQGRQTSVLTAKQGLYTMGNGSLDARGDVVVQSTDGGRLTTEHLIYDKALFNIRSDTAFTYTSPTETLRGAAFESDREFRNVRVVKPRGVQRRGGVELPER